LGRPNSSSGRARRARQEARGLRPTDRKIIPPLGGGQITTNWVGRLPQRSIDPSAQSLAHRCLVIYGISRTVLMTWFSVMNSHGLET
jgi:hypothetical protein